jgi:hypothetical protein
LISDGKLEVIQPFTQPFVLFVSHASLALLSGGLRK